MDGWQVTAVFQDDPSGKLKGVMEELVSLTGGPRKGGKASPQRTTTDMNTETSRNLELDFNDDPRSTANFLAFADCEGLTHRARTRL